MNVTCVKYEYQARRQEKYTDYFFEYELKYYR